MTRLPSVLVFLAGVLPAATLAETVGVLSGDHDGFTRLVIQLGAPEDWTFGRVEGGFEFRPGRDDISYRLDRVWNKIGRSRLADLSDLGDGRLRLSVGCNCHGVVDELADGQVVLDIVTGVARTPGEGVDAMLPPFSTPADAADVSPPAPEPLTNPVAVSDRAGLPLTIPRGGHTGALPIARPEGAFAQDSPAAPSASATPTPAPTPTPELSDPTGRDTRVTQTGTVLLEQIARAAAQGLLDADLSEIEENVADAAPPAPAEPPPPEIVRPVAPAAPRGHITVETGVDRAATRTPFAAETADGEICIDPALFAIADWGGAVDNGADIGAYRSGLIGEFDVADGDGVTALARNYIYITFGAEAKALMQRYPGSVERADLLFAMAEIMDEGASSAARDFEDQMACDGATALWATLAQAELRPGQPVNRDAVTMAFTSLPAHLRTHLGPGLADKLLAAGERNTADIIRAAIERANGGSSSEYGLLSARFDADAGRTEDATATLDDVVAAGDATLPEALLQRVETTLAAGGAVPDDIVTLLDSLALQFRGTPTAGLMVDAAVRARGSAARFTEAFDQLDAATAGGALPPERAAVLREGLFAVLAKDTDDTAFLRLTLPRLASVPGLAPDARHMLAARLLDLGFAGSARAALGSDGTMPREAERLLLARAALIERRPAVAIGYLAGLVSAEAEQLRAAALGLAQDYAGALRAYESLGDTDQARDAAWRGGLWDEVAMRDQGAVGAAAALMVGAPSPDSEGRPSADRLSLAAAQDLIAESEEARATLNTLLQSLRAPGAAAQADPQD